VPSLSGVPESGRDVTLIVANEFSSDTRTIQVVPVDRPVSGNLVDVLWETVTPNPVLVGQGVRLGYRLRSRVGTNRTFTVNPVVSRAELQSGIEVRDEQNALITNHQIQLGSLQEKLFFVQLPVLSGGITTGTTFAVTVSAVSGGVTGSDSRTFTVGTAVTPSDPTITLSVANFNAVDDAGDPVPGDGSYDASTKTIRLRAGRFGRMELGATFEQAGTYNVTLVPSGVTNGWTKNLDTGSSIVIDESDLGSEQATRLVRFNLQVLASATPSQVEVRIQRVGATTDERVGFQLALLS
jgi:hypothetical protein